MKIINLDELEQKCLEFGIKNSCFTKNDLGKDNLVTMSIRGMYENKTIDIVIKGLYKSGFNGMLETLRFTSTTWEDLYYQLREFFK